MEQKMLFKSLCTNQPFHIIFACFGAADDADEDGLFKL
jgi:uncharacterized metal-binding protein